ncbi:hypothetical protein Hanom_Chr16g01415171 [Helianthus anomalus]
MIVTGTEGGQWGDIWYVSSTFPYHFSGKLNVFKRIKDLVGVETKSFLHIRFLFIMTTESNVSLTSAANVNEFQQLTHN